eukprot:CAMPEP_0116543578 /NCGR_PEP_ID=MMETSP0397-20121206/1642_1 /TAXON_ID=216820 /ORGANISM="Cyclophora tenuis, Strain ECT3854" /LENGTH=110 /DNA_ID=CAMNT_0004067699 /DNA_START=25 /DNA_END=360 /DNA_ORIENTATION=+
MAKIGRLLVGSASPVESSARSIAKDRLSLILASQRGSEILQGVDMDALQADVLHVVKEHIRFTKKGPVQIQLNKDGDVTVFEMSVELESSSHQPGSTLGIQLENHRQHEN